jgi:ATP-binding cassette, subfamily B, bacterial
VTDRADRLALRVVRAGMPWTLLLVLATLAQAGLGLAVPAVLGGLTDAVLVPGGTPRVVLVLGGLLAALTAFEATSSYLEARCRTRSLRWTRTEFLRRVFAFDLTGQRHYSTGDLVGRFTNNTLQVSASPMSVTSLGTALLTSVGGLVALFVIDVRLGLVFVLGLPVVWGLSAYHLRRMTDTNTDYITHHNTVATRLDDAMRGMRTIRASGTAEQEVSRILRPVGSLTTSALELWRLQTRIELQTSLLQPVLRIGVLAVGGYAVADGRLGPGALLAASGYLGFALGVLQYIPMMTDVGLIRGSARLLDDVFTRRSLPSGDRSPAPGAAAVTLRGVGVELDGDRVLDGLDLDVPPGATMAVVGRSGAGKTTLSAVVGGLLEPGHGSVTMDGIPLSDLRRDELRSRVAFAYERPNLLGVTLRDALTYGDPSTTDEELDRALDVTRSEFVRRLPARLGTGADDLRLSGGELQRLGLARAACRRAKLVVLDDALSSVDTATEATITGALTGTASTATRFLIAHRPSTAAAADLVAWLEDGRIRAVAPHRQLCGDADYRALFAETPDRASGSGARDEVRTDGR